MEEKPVTAPQFSVDSEIKEERLIARRNRIAARNAAAKKDPREKVEVPKSVLDRVPHKSIQQVTESRQLIDNLHEQGTDKVTMIRVTADLAEMNRRNQEDKAREARRRRVVAEQEEVAVGIQEIENAWSKAIACSNYSALGELLQSQKTACDNLIAQKDKLIQELQNELKTKDDDYVKNLRAAGSDVDFTLQYMQDQSNSLIIEYRRQLEEIEVTFMLERNDLLAAMKKEWTSLMNQRRELENSYLINRENKINEYENQLNKLREDDTTEFNQIKKKLENDIMALEQQLAQMRATYLLNSEKLEYNFQVLKKRDEENLVTISQQKRKITRNLDAVNQFRIKLAKQEKIFHDDNITLTEDYKRITEQFKELQKKAHHFQSLDSERYDEVWLLNEEICVDLAKKVLDADKVIYEQQLGFAWQPPSEQVFVSRIDSNSQSNTQNNSFSVAEFLQTEGAVVGEIESSKLKAALDMLCDEAGFLLESKLNILLKNLDKNEQSMIKLDSIFKALGIEDSEDIHRLASYFVKKTDDGIISHNEVLFALRSFADDSRKQKSQTNKNNNNNNRSSDFWSNLIHVIPENHDHDWKCLLDALNNYHSVLTDRSQAIKTIEEVRRENMELKMLLQQYLGAKTNDELIFPPTVVLMKELSAKK